MQKRALITGVTGQDGSYLAEYLLSLGYEVFGMVRRSSTSNLARLEADDCKVLSDPRFHILQGDLTDSSSLESAMKTAKPHEVYNLGAQSFV